MRTLNSLFLIALSGTVLLSACGNDKPAAVTEPSEKPAISLADIKARLEAGEVRVGEAPAIDPAAKNINPFQRWDNYQRREAWDALIDQARMDDQYLERSLLLTEESLAGLPLSLPLMEYEALLRGAAAVHASALTGQSTAHDAQTNATALIHFGMSMGSIRDLETKVGSRIHINEFKKRTADFDKRTYLNYFLILDALMENPDKDQIAKLADEAISTLPPDFDREELIVE